MIVATSSALQQQGGCLGAEALNFDNLAPAAPSSNDPYAAPRNAKSVRYQGSQRFVRSVVDRRSRDANAYGVAMQPDDFRF